MNAPNPLMPESRPLSEPTLGHLRRALAEQRRSPSDASNGELQQALQAVATEARAHALRPEELIVTLKQIMDESSPGRVPTVDDRRLREWIVTTCIRAYFDTK
jgi:hypothetical protein